MFGAKRITRLPTNFAYAHKGITGVTLISVAVHTKTTMENVNAIHIDCNGQGTSITLYFRWELTPRLQIFILPNAFICDFDSTENQEQYEDEIRSAREERYCQRLYVFIKSQKFLENCTGSTF